MSKRKTKSQFRQYRVVWEIDIAAASPKAAAKIALKIQRNPDSIATIFDCCDDKGDVKRVDLTENTIESPA